MPFDPSRHSYDNCPVEAATQIIGGKWKSVILSRLMLEGVMRFGALRKSIPVITPRMLTAQLRQMEADGLVTRTIYPEVPPRVEYDLTDVGRALQPALMALADWSVDYLSRTPAGAGSRPSR